MTRLARLQVEAFRGIMDSTLTFDDGSIVLGGGNGTGKTGFVDAIEFLYTGNVATLAGAAGLSLRHHGSHIQASIGDARITAGFDDPNLSMTRWLSGQLDVPSELEGHLAMGSRVSFILRRSQLQQFIHAQPADRYRSMADLIGVDRLDRTEQALKRARDAIEHDLAGNQAQLAHIDQQLASLPEEEVSDAELLDEANVTLDTLGFTEYRLHSFDDLATVRSSILRTVANHRPDPREEAQARLASELKRDRSWHDLRDALSTYLQLKPDGTGGNRAHMLDLLQLLQHGRDYLESAETDRCPLCEQEVESRRLLGRLVKRVAELEDVSLQQQRLERARDDLEAALQDAGGQVRSLQRAQQEAGIVGTATASLGDAMLMLRESVRDQALIESTEMARRVESSLARWETWAHETLGSLGPAPELDGDTEVRTEAANVVLALLQDVAARRSQIERGREERTRLQRSHHQLRSAARLRERELSLADVAYTTFIHVKNGEVQALYDQLRADLVRFYDFLHPDEGHSGLSIAMDLRKRGSSELKMDYYGREDQDPRAYGSEGHLDSLGLCIFLAFVKHFNGDWPLLVLDDVVTSVDADHKRRVARLLFEEFGDRQLVITTHDAHWFNDLRRAEEETGHTGDTRNLVIEGWSIEEGPRLRVAS
jgi:AAA domain